MSKERILIIDDEVNVCRTLQVIMEDEGYVVVTAQDGQTALRLFQEEPFDVVLSDIRMANVDGMMVLERIKEIRPMTIVVLITGYGTMNTAIEAFRSGADDFVPKPLDMDYLKKRIRTSLDSRSDMARAELELAREKYGLTVREAQVVSQVQLGHTNADIAKQLGISEGTVKVHLEHVYAKVGVHSRTALVARLRQQVQNV